MSQEEKHPTVIQQPGQPDLVIPPTKNLSAVPAINEQQYFKNKAVIAQHRQFKLEAARKQEDAK